MRHRDPVSDEQRRELDALDRALAGEPVDPALRELEELVREVRATAPEMTPGFAARLEEEVRSGFPTSPQAARRRDRRALAGRRWMLLPAAGSLAAVIVALVIVLGTGAGSGGGGGGGTGTADQVARDNATPSAPQTEAASPAAGGKATGSAAPSVAQAPPAAVPSTAAIAPAPARKVQRSAVLSLRTPEDRFEQTTDAVGATVARFGGIVASSQIGASDAAGGEATFDLRIPTARLDRALADLSRLGLVTERTQTLQDITASFASVQDRLTDARAERRGLLRALGRATTQNQVASIKAQLRTVSSRIAGLKGELSSLRRRADLSRVDLTVRGDGASGGGAGGGDWTPRDAAGDALRVIEVLAGVALVALAVLVPLGLITAAVLLVVRSARRRRRESALDPA
jgi:hypothetical protein